MHSKNKILSILLAIVMVLGTFNPIFATGLDARPSLNENPVEIEGTNEGGKLVFHLSEDDNESRVTDSGLEISAFSTSAQRGSGEEATADGEPAIGENRVVVKVNLTTINNSVTFNDIFKEGAKVKLEMFNEETYDTEIKTKEFTASGQEIDFGIYTVSYTHLTLPTTPYV